MEQPPWLAAAWGEFGVRESAGRDDTAAVLAYYREAGHPEIAHDEVAWCAAFAGTMLVRGGQTPTGSLLARSYLGWGAPLEGPRMGAITVLERGDDPGAGHVGFLVGHDKARVFLLGGNQSDRVSVAAFDVKRVIAYRWPGDAAAPVAANADATGIFERALAHVLKMEGGFSDDPYDSGGPTNRGITLQDYASWTGVTVDATSRDRLVGDLERIPDEKVREIYGQRYWRPACCAQLPAAIALMHFDAAVNHGVGTAAHLLQQAVGVSADGEIGPLTLAAIEHRSLRDTLERYAELRRARYRGLTTFWRFGRGWLARVDATEALALRIAGNPKTHDATEGTKAMDQGFTFPLPGEQPDAAATGGVAAGKWWPQSKTVWGALITAVTVVLPVLGPLIGINISADMIKVLGDQTVAVIQALGGLFGTLLTLYGRVNATVPLVRKLVSVKI